MSKLSNLAPEMLDEILQRGKISFKVITLFLCGDSLLNRNIIYGLTSVDLRDTKYDSTSTFPTMLTWTKKLRKLRIDRSCRSLCDIAKLQESIISLPPTLDTIAFSFAECQSSFLSRDDPNEMIHMSEKFPKLTYLKVKGDAVWNSGHLKYLPKSLLYLWLPVHGQEEGQIFHDLSLFPPNIRTLSSPALKDISPQSLAKLPQSITKLKTNRSVNAQSINIIGTLPRALKFAPMKFLIDRNAIEANPNCDMVGMRFSTIRTDWAQFLPPKLTSLKFDHSAMVTTSSNILSLPTSLMKLNIARLDLRDVSASTFNFPLKSLTVRTSFNIGHECWKFFPTSIHTLELRSKALCMDAFCAIVKQFQLLKSLNCVCDRSITSLPTALSESKHLVHLKLNFQVEVGELNLSLTHPLSKKSILPDGLKEFTLSNVDVTDICFPTKMERLSIIGAYNFSSSSVELLPSTLIHIHLEEVYFMLHHTYCFSRFARLESLVFHFYSDGYDPVGFARSLPSTLKKLVIKSSNVNHWLLKHLPTNITHLDVSNVDVLSEATLSRLPSNLRKCTLVCEKYEEVIDDDKLIGMWKYLPKHTSSFEFSIEDKNNGRNARSFSMGR